LKPLKFRSDINGLRALAVMIVVFFHFGILGFDGGFIGVDVFFVISGYLMTSIILNRIDNKSFSITGFYLDRAKRIIPALAALCFSVAALGWFILLPEQYEQLGSHIATSIAFLSNIMYWSEGGNYFNAGSHSKWLLHTWSLSVEWQFYIIYPLLITFIMKSFGIRALKIILVLLTIISFVISVVITNQSPTSAFYLLPSRAWEMLVGGLLFIYPFRLSNNTAKLFERAGLSFIILGITIFSASNLWPGYLAFIPVFGSLLILAANRTDSIFTNNPISQWVGKTSYSIYLWHWPVVVLLNYFNVQDKSLFIIIGLFCTLLLSSLSFYFIESKTHYFKYKSSSDNLLKNSLFLSSTAMVFTIGMIGVLIFNTKGVPERTSFYQSFVDINNPRSSECNVYPNSDLKSPLCVYGNRNNILAIVLGDSHSNATVTAVEKSMRALSGGTLFMGADGCFSLINIFNSYFKRCNEYNAWVRETILNDDMLHGLPIVIINNLGGNLIGNGNKTIYVNEVAFGSKNYIKQFTEEYKTILCELRKTNPIFIVQPTPKMSTNVSDYLVRKELFDIGEDNLHVSISEHNAVNTQSLALLADVANSCDIVLLDPIPYMCTNNSCPAIKENQAIYYDRNHLSEFGNKLLVPMFEKIWK